MDEMDDIDGGGCEVAELRSCEVAEWGFSFSRPCPRPDGRFERFRRQGPE